MYYLSMLPHFRSNRCDKSFQPPLRLEQNSLIFPFPVNFDLSGRSYRRTSPRNVTNGPVWPQKQSKRLDQALRCSTCVKWGPEGVTWSFVQEILTSELRALEETIIHEEFRSTL